VNKNAGRLTVLGSGQEKEFGLKRNERTGLRQ